MPDRSRAIDQMMHRGFLSILRRGLRGVWLRGALPPGPFVWAANHHSWWDPFLAMAVLDSHQRQASLLMQQENIAQYGFVRRLGVFGSAQPRRGLDYLEQGRVLVIFPEGDLRPAGPPGPLARGAAWYARRAHVPLLAVASRLLLRGHQAPEAYLTCSPVDLTGTLAEVTERLALELTRQLCDLDGEVAAADPRRALPGYDVVLRGRRSWDERIDAITGWWPWRT